MWINGTDEMSGLGRGRAGGFCGTSRIRLSGTRTDGPHRSDGDNGPAFIARAVGDLLVAWGILRLDRPVAAPQYNDLCEATSGSQIP
jgi:hypothetical protein